MRSLAGSIVGIGILLGAASAQAADLPVKARPLPVTPSWTGFYVGVQAGGAFADRTVGYTGDPAAAILLTANPILGLPGQQPVSPLGFRASGATGGVEAGYNWQVSPNWLLGVETDFSAGGPKGRGTGTSILASVPPITIFQNATSDQRVDWWGTVRGRVGALATPDLLLFGSAGFAYGRVSSSDSYSNVSPGPLALNIGFLGTAFTCNDNMTCFAGSSATVKTGWTAGGGGEWRFAPHWTLKVEYLYVDLGRDRVRANATAPGTGANAGFALSSYLADFGRTDFHVVRAGVNYQF
jgi:outer membrane immunogenic protein